MSIAYDSGMGVIDRLDTYILIEVRSVVFHSTASEKLSFNTFRVHMTFPCSNILAYHPR